MRRPRRGRAIPGRGQCRAHGRPRGGDVQAVAGADGAPPIPCARGDRQRRGNPPAGAAEGGRGAGGPGRELPGPAPHRRPGPRHPAVPPGGGAADRGVVLGRRPPGDHPPRHRPVLQGQGGPGPRRPDRRPLPPGRAAREAQADRRLQEPSAGGDAPRLRAVRRRRGRGGVPGARRGAPPVHLRRHRQAPRVPRRRQEADVRGGAGLAAGRRSRQLSVRHQLQLQRRRHGPGLGRAGEDRSRPGAGGA